MAEFTIDGINYRSRRMDAYTQGHILRRLLPIADPIVKLIAGQNSDPAAIISELANSLSSLSDQQYDYIANGCYKFVQRKQGEGWPSIQSSDGRQLIFEDIDLNARLEILYYVIRENFEPVFLKALARLKSEGKLSSLIG